VVGCRTGNTARDCHHVSPASVSGNNTGRDVVIETVHARQAEALPHVTNKSAAQGMSTVLTFFLSYFPQHLGSSASN